MLGLPQLKKRRFPRVEEPPREEKLINGSADDHIDDHFMGEIFDACESKDIAKFRSAVEALIMNMFDYGDEDASDAREK